MLQYKCIRSFKTQNGMFHYYGNKIGQLQYDNLKSNEKGNFNKIQESTNDSFSVDSSNLDSYSPPSDYGSSPSSDSSSFDFGGGDTGGGGASGDW